MDSPEAPRSDPIRVPSTGGAELAAYDFGGAGPPILFAHATGLHAHVWLPVIAHLRDEFRCFAFDERGHGHSAIPPGEPEEVFSWDRFAEDALAVVDRLGLVGDRQPFGVGHSCGGALSIRAEAERPGTYRALWCFEPVVMAQEEAAAPNPESGLAVGARRRREVFPSRQAAYDNYAAKLPFSAVDPAALAAYVEYGFEDLAASEGGGVRLRCRGTSEAWVFAMGGSHTTYQRARDVACPVTVARGDGFGSFSEAMLGPVVARLPQGRAEPMPGLSHFGPMEDPARVAASIRAAFGS